MTATQCFHNLSRTATRAGAAVLMAMTIALLAPPASAHRDPTIAVRLAGVTPELPGGVDLEVLDSERTYAYLRNDSDSAVYVNDPSGQPFLRISSEGAFGDVSSPYLGASQQGKDGDVLELGCCPDGRWLKLSPRPLWVWADARLDPPVRVIEPGDPRGLGQLATNEPLATFELPLVHDGQAYTASGVLERRLVGSVTMQTEVPDGVSVEIIESRPPQVRLQAAPGVTVEVLDETGQPFIRATPQGAFGRTNSFAYQQHRRASGLGQTAGSPWMKIAGSGPSRVTWADFRLDYEAELPTQGSDVTSALLKSWTIPLLIDGQPAEITGKARWEKLAPPPDPDAPEESSFFRAGGAGSYLIAVGLAAAILVAYVAARTREKRTT